MLPVRVLVGPRLYSDEISTVWELDLSDTKVLSEVKERVPENLAMKVQDGVLRFSGDLKRGGVYLAFTITFA